MTGKEKKMANLRPPWAQGQSGNIKGRPRLLIKEVRRLLEEAGIPPATAGDIRAVYMQLINLTVTELTKLAKDNEAPVFTRVVAKAILGGKGFEVIESMLNRSIESLPEQVDITSKGERLQQIDYSKLSKEALKEIVSQLDNA